MNIHGARVGNNFSASRRVLAWKSYSGSCATMHFWYFDLNFHHPFFYATPLYLLIGICLSIPWWDLHVL
jgi:hypothetical protein